jgi:tRNA pseudouridine55 synthase
MSLKPADRIQQAIGDRDEVLGSRARFELSGVLVVDKPEGITSMDVIRVIRRVLKPQKIGHGGTLDPFATGVLPILINRATKLSDQVMAGVKEYEGSFLLGQSYDTQDITGTPLHEPKPLPENLSMSLLEDLAKGFIGEIEQMPPIYSAVKKKGRPLYDYARAGEEVEREARKVRVERFEIRQWDGFRRVHFFARVHKGTYVRTLIHDLGQRLGTGAVLESLRRTQTGSFHIDEAIQLSTLKQVSDVAENLKPLRLIQQQ